MGDKMDISYGADNPAPLDSSSPEGFAGLVGDISFPSRHCLTFKVCAARTYSFACDGDLTCDINLYDDCLYFASFEWTQNARQLGVGRGKTTMTNRDRPSEPSVFNLTMDAPRLKVVLS